jgi:hypothetical protein
MKTVILILSVVVVGMMICAVVELLTTRRGP